ncbi:hypothetical protein GJAV_G00136290 [Gymnothorax javanicus]|nr:hypothetical protein GJAV_G00136290 [Gymnothorax javanicus]
MAGVLLLFAVSLPFPRTSGQDSCHEVRSSFQLLHPSVKWAPERPVSGKCLHASLQSPLLLCCRELR